jgi:endonuclease-3
MKKSIKNLLSILEHWENASCELIYHSNFQLLLAILLSAQATDRSVNQALKKIFDLNQNFSAEDLVKMGQKSFYEVIRSIGLAPRKSLYSFQTSQILLKDYEGEPPRQYEDLVRLPGVGRKTALVYLNVALGESTVPVDTHVSRVSKRLKISSVKASPLQVEKDLISLTPKKKLRNLHLAFVNHGRYICQAKKPLCESCPISLNCPKHFF